MKIYKVCLSETKDLDVDQRQGTSVTSPFIKIADKGIIRFFKNQIACLDGTTVYYSVVRNRMWRA